MTREEKIEILEKEKAYMLSHGGDRQAEALDSAIKAIEQEPCDDCVRRQEVLDILDDTVKNYIKENDFDKAQGVAWVKAQKLPPVTPKPKMGRWIVNEWGNISCSECGCTALYDKVYPGESVFGKAIRVKSNFCPTCGAKMKGSKR